MCVAFTWQGFDSGEIVGMGSVGRHQELPPCWAEPVLASSKMEMPLATAESISGFGRTSVKTFKKG